MNGTKALEGQFPYHVGLQWTNDESTFCGGSIINKRYILTAAHCIYDEPDEDSSSWFPDFSIFYSDETNEGLVAPKDIQILAGVNKLDDENGIVYKVEKIIKHEHYDNDKFLSELADIALIRVTRDIVFNDKIQPVRLASSKNQGDILPVGSPVMITGWGYTRQCLEAHDEETNYLRVAKRKISDFNECQYAYSVARNKASDESEKPPAVDRGMICSVGFQYSCMGDSGGPIVDQRGVQVGIDFREEYVNDLRMAKRSIYDFDKCQSEYLENSLKKCEEPEIPPGIHQEVICSVGFQYSCMGDSGSPVVDERGIQVGIVSFSEDLLPDVHTSVRFYSQWIADNFKITEN
uniref:Peptidase S1 domain-containing protein n=1 Tax=Trichogramma kaykai TaxID=54128 RepID=A0ABD2X1W0_9HYME